MMNINVSALSRRRSLQFGIRPLGLSAWPCPTETPTCPWLLPWFCAPIAPLSDAASTMVCWVPLQQHLHHHHYEATVATLTVAEADSSEQAHCESLGQRVAATRHERRGGSETLGLL